MIFVLFFYNFVTTKVLFFFIMCFLECGQFLNRPSTPFLLQGAGKSCLLPEKELICKNDLKIIW
jgi:hypothetical protein